MKGTKRHWLRCIKLLRAPQEDDYNSLNFARRAMPVGPAGILEEDEEGDEAFRDLDLEAEYGDWDAVENDDGEIEESGRIPPQWNPDQLIANLVFDAVETGGKQGCNSLVSNLSTILLTEADSSRLSATLRWVISGSGLLRLSLEESRKNGKKVNHSLYVIYPSLEIPQ